MTRLRLLAVVAFVLVMVGCPNLGVPENTISFTLDGVDYSYSASTGDVTHAWGQGNETGNQYYITASKSMGDADAGTNTIVIDISSEGDYWIDAFVYDGSSNEMWFDLGSADRILLENTFRNLDDVGEQLQAVFWGPYEWGVAPTHTLENLVISVERLPNQEPPQAE